MTARAPTSAIVFDRSFGVIGGADPLANADVIAKLMQTLPTALHAHSADVIVDEPRFGDDEPDIGTLSELKLHVFDAVQQLRRQCVDTVLLPCMTSHTFAAELRSNTDLLIVDLLAALREHLRREHPHARRIGMIVPAAVRKSRLFDPYFDAAEFTLLYPSAVCADADALVRDGSGMLLHAALEDLAAQRADVIVPGLTGIVAQLKRTGPHATPYVDCNLAYVEYAVSVCLAGAAVQPAPPERLKIGIVGGVGPAATVDFLSKIVRNTPAARDQEHLKVIVEQNPQIPDRTGNLIGGGLDPTIALYATCKKLEAGDADLIAIPCNTAHAFVARIQRRLDIPIVNMLTETVRYIRAMFPDLRDIGVLATSGTVASGVYRDALNACELRQVLPNPVMQERVMCAIYGERGVKAGYTSGTCVDDLHLAIDDLAARGVDVVILGCTELPLLVDNPHYRAANGRTITLVDPSDVLAQCCVAYALAGRAPGR
ncbi:aspartate racemase [Caballeronia sordidicola]|uniref:Aspartate racemase n=1 Tax=Caballeronia sordidicola TaxID=196367 RepID=A0A158GD40_CABSO|nr:amino acid racemase [Caballeronia sordidicola]SAL29837.1 aspartate racemase [Caballeronia sordidicola]